MLTSEAAREQNIWVGTNWLVIILVTDLIGKWVRVHVRVCYCTSILPIFYSDYYDTSNLLHMYHFCSLEQLHSDSENSCVAFRSSLSFYFHLLATACIRSLVLACFSSAHFALLYKFTSIFWRASSLSILVEFNSLLVFEYHLTRLI